jgi:hypothetical protein
MYESVLFQHTAKSAILPRVKVLQIPSHTKDLDIGKHLFGCYRQNRKNEDRRKGLVQIGRHMALVSAQLQRGLAMKSDGHTLTCKHLIHCTP